MTQKRVFLDFRSIAVRSCGRVVVSMSGTKDLSNPSPMQSRSELRERLLARVAFEAVWERDLHTDALNFDENLESIFGYRREEVVNHLDWWRTRVHVDDADRVEQIVTEA